MIAVKATPNGTRMMWNPRVKAIIWRAGSTCEESAASSGTASASTPMAAVFSLRALRARDGSPAPAVACHQLPAHARQRGADPLRPAHLPRPAEPGQLLGDRADRVGRDPQLHPTVRGGIPGGAGAGEPPLPPRHARRGAP